MQRASVHGEHETRQNIKCCNIEIIMCVQISDYTMSFIKIHFFLIMFFRIL